MIKNAQQAQTFHELHDFMKEAGLLHISMAFGSVADPNYQLSVIMIRGDKANEKMARIRELLDTEYGDE